MMRRIQFFLMAALGAAALTACGDDLAKEGEACEATADCQGDLTCEADTSENAEEGAKVCTAPAAELGKLGDACDEEAKCEAGLICEDKVCAKDETTQPEECTFTTPAEAVGLCVDELAKYAEVKDKLQDWATAAAVGNGGLELDTEDAAAMTEFMEATTCDLAEKSGLSNDCAYCTIIVVGCGTAHCAAKCGPGGDEDECDACLAENCADENGLAEICVQGEQTTTPEEGEKGGACRDEAGNECDGDLVCEEDVCVEDEAAAPVTCADLNCDEGEECVEGQDGADATCEEEAAAPVTCDDLNCDEGEECVEGQDGADATCEEVV